MDVKNYRKKPVVIQAVLVEEGAVAIACQWCDGTLLYGFMGDEEGIRIPTLEGNMTADIGDYIIRGVKGEFYPCKPDVFDLTYEPIE